MRENTTEDRLHDAWRQCLRHRHHMQHALSSLRAHLPLTGEALIALDDEAIQALDQFVLRFGRLQDAMGTRLLPAILDYLQEPFEDRPMLDKLHRLEKLGYVDDAEQWQRLRVIRNRFSHEYPDDPDKNAALLNLAVDAASELAALLDRIAERLPFLKDSF